MFLSREIFSKSVFSLALLFNSSIGIANTCNDLIDQEINDFIDLCSGSIQCQAQHEWGHFVPTGQFVGRAPSANISSGKLELKCQLQGKCAPGTYGSSGVPDRSYDLCNSNLSYLSLETKISHPLHANNAKYCGSVVGLDDQTLGESIPIIGAKFSLNYFSHFNAGRGNYSIVIPLSGAVPDSDTSSFTIRISSDDGEYVSETIANSANLSYKYIWDGKNKVGQNIGLKKFKVDLIQNFLSDPARITLSETVTLGGFNAKELGIGGWLPSIYRFYNSETKQLFSGDGNVLNISATPVLNISGISYMIGERDRSLIHYFDSRGRIKYSQTGRTGVNLFTFTYDVSGRLLTIDEPFSLKTIFQRDSNGKIFNIVSPRGLFTPPAGVTPGTYESHSGESGKFVTRVTLDNNENLIRLRLIDGPNGGVGNPYYEMIADERGLLTSFKLPGGRLSTFNYDMNGNLIKDQNSSGYFFELVKDLLSATSYKVTKTDSLRNPLTVEISENSDGTSNRTTINSNGVEVLEVNAPLTSSVSLSGYSTENIYVGDSRVVGPRYLTQKTISNGSNTINLTSSRSVSYLTGNSSPSAIYSETYINQLGTSRNIFMYNSSNRVFRQFRQKLGTYINGPYTDVQVDQYERPISIKRGSLNAATLTYNQDKLASITQGGSTNSYSYNNFGELISISTPINPNYITFSYNPSGRVKSQTMASGTTNFSYDADGNLLSLQLANGPFHSFSFDIAGITSSWLTPLNKLTKYHFNSDQTLKKIEKPSGKDIEYSYFASGSLSSIQTVEGSYSFTYDVGLGLLSSILNPDFLKTEVGYDGRRIASLEVKNNLGTRISKYSSAEKMGTPLKESDSASLGMNEVIIDYLYNDDFFRTKAGEMNISYDANDLISGTTLGSTTETFTRNTDGEITSRVVKYNSTVIFSEVVTYDSNKRAKKIVQIHPVSVSPRTDEFFYDANSQLVLSRSTTNSIRGPMIDEVDYEYFGNGNVVAKPRTMSSPREIYEVEFNDDDHLLQYKVSQFRDTLEDNQFEYDLDGTLLFKKNNKTGLSTFYTYDSLGNLKHVNLENGNTIGYEIDGFGRRIGKKINGTLKKRWVYMDQTRIAAEFDYDTNTFKRFVYATDRHVPDYMVIGSEKYRLVSDRKGSIKVIINVSNGAVVWTTDYSDWGERSEQADNAYIPFGFAGGLWDQHTKWTRFGTRDYDSRYMRWTSKDSVGFWGGDTNLYGYVGNDPINFIDPRGLWSISVNLFAGYGGSITIGQNPNGSYFGSVRVGVGVGAGVSWDPHGSSPDGGSCKGISTGQYAEGSAHFGPLEAVLNTSSGYSQSKGSYYNRPQLSGSVVPSIGVGAGVSGGFELTFQ